MPVDVSLTLRVNVTGDCHQWCEGLWGEKASRNITWWGGGGYKEKHDLVAHLSNPGAAFQRSEVAKLCFP